eukprot:m.99430 g.99430  ORF g.99430 m.99430 type:complete len:116 (+) comp9030_c1_seq5:2597-2944(+)
MISTIVPCSTPTSNKFSFLPFHFFNYMCPFASSFFLPLHVFVAPLFPCCIHHPSHTPHKQARHKRFMTTTYLDEQGSRWIATLCKCKQFWQAHDACYSLRKTEIYIEKCFLVASI